MSKLAILGGNSVIKGEIPPFPSIGEEEAAAVTRVIKSGKLSNFYGSFGPQFLGGYEIKAFEEAWQQKFGVKYAVSVNSATSGLFAAMGAIGIEPGDEVIVPPYTMSATAMAPLIYGGVPVFVDIEPDTFCLNPELVKQCITSNTKAIIAVNLFGHPARLHELLEICRNNNIYLIEDNAQGPLAMEHGKWAGTIGHIGVFSLNYHKHIHTGEGGICVTNDDELAQRLQLIRNHGENIVEDLNIVDISNLLGFNYRMTELSAAIGLIQLNKAEKSVQLRIDSAKMLSAGIKDLPGLTAPVERAQCRHVYYLWSMRYDKNITGISREAFSRALAAEGFPHFNGYVRPLYLLPIFQRKIAFGTHGYPFNLSNTSYEKGLCPVAERMHTEDLICFENCMFDLNTSTIKLLIDSIHKVYENRQELRSL